MEQTKTVEKAPLKLNYKRTFIIGFAFFGILMLWQIYNNYCPIILTELLGAQLGKSSEDVQYLVGIIMAMDNVFALFMLPIFGYLSDHTKSKFGKRMPYIILGTVLASLALICLPIAYAYNSLVGFVISMALVLIFMQAYRNPAVALMPDITPKPLRAKANGIINLVGYIGAIAAGALALVINAQTYFLDSRGTFMMYLPFIISAVFMIATMIVLAVMIKENKIIEEMRDDLARGELEAEVEEPLQENHKLSKKNRNSLILLVIAIFLWFAAFNAVETFWSNYSNFYLEFKSYSLGIIVLTIASLITFVPAGFLADKIGRKWTIIIGIIIMILSMLGIFFISPLFTNIVVVEGTFTFVYYAIFVIAGIGWALINCCSYPMVVELSTASSIGKFTGIYYASSMLAQSLTPIALGALIGTSFSWDVMFPYSAILFTLALVVFMFVKGSKGRKMPVKKGLAAFDQD
ncbi:MAG: MFS transporter [Erysipelotrichaceae bacterium]|jgi:MFS family permease|nr:MFS transporter [Erysipelotrichaceae bacterium]